MLFGVSALPKLLSVPAGRTQYVQCALGRRGSNPIKTHWHVLFAAVFQAVCLVVFSSVVTVSPPGGGYGPGIT